ncbi:unnamed protein product [Ambrosiozyma monospora]|uniref:Unnamed protein product n=1 Tax=Ambrosiozyma monospora TaxID=43982 RepID=A0ACB5UCY0_AMBMO|nr:unnamed protein product [Ambrosiozyma monospora]
MSIKKEFHSMVSTLQQSVIQLQNQYGTTNIESFKHTRDNTTPSSSTTTTTVQQGVLKSQVQTQTRAPRRSIRAFRTLLRLSWSLFKICAILYLIFDIYVCYFYNSENEIGLGLNYDSYGSEQGNVNGQSSKEFKKMQKRKLKKLKKLKKIRDKNRKKQRGKHGSWNGGFNFRDGNGGVVGLALCFIYFVIYVFDL